MFRFRDHMVSGENSIVGLFGSPTHPYPVILFTYGDNGDSHVLSHKIRQHIFNYYLIRDYFATTRARRLYNRKNLFKYLTLNPRYLAKYTNYNREVGSTISMQIQ